MTQPDVVLRAATKKVRDRSFIVSRVGTLPNWTRGAGAAPRSGRRFGFACCAVELMHAAATGYDIDRIGLAFRAGRPQSGLTIGSGTVCTKMASALRKVCARMPQLRYVISMGLCANGGGYCHYSYSAVRGCDRTLPVDVSVPRCPPSEQLLSGVLVLQKKIRRGRTFER